MNCLINFLKKQILMNTFFRFAETLQFERLHNLFLFCNILYHHQDLLKINVHLMK